MKYPSFAPDGAFAVFSYNTTQDLMLLALSRDGLVQPLVQTKFIEENGEISPDGRWIAYESNQLGQREIYVRDGRYFLGSAQVTHRTYDVSPDGLDQPVGESEQSTPASITVVLNWHEELKRLVPTR
jgi:Tol biopolymer transport system component